MSHSIKVQLRDSSSPVMQIWMAFNEKKAAKYGVTVVIGCLDGGKE